MKTKKKIFVIIPAYNEEKSIGTVVKDILKKNKNTICVVIDDCSTDKTSSIAKKAGAHVIRNNQNVGTGLSTKIGLLYARNRNADLVITMDADGQHDPMYISQLIKAVESNSDYVIASRYLTYTDHVTSLSRRLGTKFISLFLYFAYGKKITDPTSGYRAFNLQKLSYITDMYPTKFSEPELILDLLERKIVISEISCQMNKRKFGKSSISSEKALSLMLFILQKICKRRINNFNIMSVSYLLF